jgi:hypothetical protein
MYYVGNVLLHAGPLKAASWVALRHNKLSVPMSTQICRWTCNGEKKLIIETNNGVGDQEYVTSLMNLKVSIGSQVSIQVGNWQ